MREDRRRIRVADRGTYWRRIWGCILLRHDWSSPADHFIRNISLCQACTRYAVGVNGPNRRRFGWRHKERLYQRRSSLGGQEIYGLEVVASPRILYRIARASRRLLFRLTDVPPGGYPGMTAAGRAIVRTAIEWERQELIARALGARTTGEGPYTHTFAASPDPHAPTITIRDLQQVRDEWEAELAFALAEADSERIHLGRCWRDGCSNSVPEDDLIGLCEGCKFALGRTGEEGK